MMLFWKKKLNKTVMVRIVTSRGPERDDSN